MDQFMTAVEFSILLADIETQAVRAAADNAAHSALLREMELVEPMVWTVEADMEAIGETGRLGLASGDFRTATAAHKALDWIASILGEKRAVAISARDGMEMDRLYHLRARCWVLMEALEIPSPSDRKVAFSVPGGEFRIQYAEPALRKFHKLMSKNKRAFVAPKSKKRQVKKGEEA